MDFLLRKEVKGKKKARGLAVIIYNSYEGTRNYLSGTLRDGEAMKKTFEFLGFATIDLCDITKGEVEDIIKALATYSDYPERYDCFAIYFAGHGDKNSVLVATDEEFDLEEVIVQRLNQKIFGDVADHITKAKILVFIDACRGDQDPLRGRIRHGDRVPDNLMVAYATREKFMALEDPRGGGIWTQKVARALRTSNRSVRDILDGVRDNMPPQYKREALPVTWNPAAGNIKLLIKPPGGDGGGGQRGGDRGADRDDDINPKGGQAKELQGGGQKFNIGTTQQIVLATGMQQGGSGATNAPGKRPSVNALTRLGIISKVSSKWHKLGIYFGLSVGDLDGYASMKALLSNEDCCERVFNHWIENGGGGYPVNWKGVYQVLCDIQHKTAAEDMKEELARKGLW